MDLSCLFAVIPVPYPFFEVPFDMLPPLAQHEITGTPISEDLHESLLIVRERIRRHNFDLSRRVSGVQMAVMEALSKLWRDEANISDVREELSNVFAPEHHKHLAEYIVRYDALVWLQTNIEKGLYGEWSGSTALSARDEEIREVMGHTRLRFWELFNEVWGRAGAPPPAYRAQDMPSIDEAAEMQIPYSPTTPPQFTLAPSPSQVPTIVGRSNSEVLPMVPHSPQTRDKPRRVEHLNDFVIDKMEGLFPNDSRRIITKRRSVSSFRSRSNATTREG